MFVVLRQSHVHGINLCGYCMSRLVSYLGIWLCVRVFIFLRFKDGREFRQINPLPTLMNLQYCMYSETSPRPLPWKTTCLEGPQISERSFYIPVMLNLAPKTTCVERSHCYSQWNGLSTIGVCLHLLANMIKWGLMLHWSTTRGIIFLSRNF